MAAINTIFRLVDNVTPPLNMIKRGFSDLTTKIFAVNQALQLFNSVSGAFGNVAAKMGEMTDAYNYQAEQEMKLATIMRQRMNATNEDIQAIKDLASAQQNLGIYGDEVILQGAQELASFTSSRKAIETLIPAMNNLIAQQYGYSASGAQFQSTADMMGKVLSGQTGALSKMGYIFSEEEKQMLQFGTEEQKAAALAKIITDNVSRMNEAFAKTPRGQIQQLNNMMGDLKETTGGILLPLQQEMTIFKSKVVVDFYGSMNRIFEKIVPYIRSLVRAFQDIYTKAKPYIDRMGRAIENGIGKALLWVREHLTELAAAIAALASVWVAKTIVMAAAWAVMNWPIVVVVGSIALIISLLLKMGVTTEQVGEKAGAAFGFLFGNLYNLAVDFYNMFASVSDLIVNIKDHPLQALANFLADILASVYDGLSTILTAVDAVGRVLGKDWNLGEAMKKVADGIRNAKVTQDLELTPRLEKKTAEEIEADMKTVGGNIGNKVDSAMEIIKDALKNGITTADIEEAIGGAFSFGSGGALLATDPNQIDIADDYRDLLSAKATEKFGVRFNQMTPQVSVQNLNINNGDSAESAVAGLIEAASENAYARGYIL